MHLIYFGYEDVPSGRGIESHDAGIRNGVDFHEFSITYKVMYPFSKIGFKL